MPEDTQPPSAPPAPAPLQPEPDPTTGVRHTTESLLYLLHQGQREGHREILDRLERLESTTWLLVVREQLDRPIPLPGGREVKVGTVLLLLGGLVALFGSDRIWGALPDWLSPGVAP